MEFSKNPLELGFIFFSFPEIIAVEFERVFFFQEPKIKMMKMGKFNLKFVGYIWACKVQLLLRDQIKLWISFDVKAKMLYLGDHIQSG